MSKGPAWPGHKGRKPAVPDFELWAEIARHVRPLKHHKRRQAEEAQPLPGLHPATGHDQKPSPRAIPAAAAPARPQIPPSPPLTGIDRRMRRRLTRGDAEIDSRLDLHGESIESARVRLRSFVADARHRGSRLVLVITGKGASPFTQHTLHGTSHFHAPERQGRLRRLVIEWLAEPEFRVHVSGFQPAHPRHGGGGALYVRLRRPKGHGGGE